jgi:hypothetical protein
MLILPRPCPQICSTLRAHYGAQTVILALGNCDFAIGRRAALIRTSANGMALGAQGRVAFGLGNDW